MLLFEKLLLTNPTGSDNKLWTWGRNTNGQTGQNTVVATSQPTQVGTLTNWKYVNASGRNGTDYSCMHAVKTDGTLWAWGANTSGILGLNDVTTKRSSPVQVGSLTNWSSLYSINRHKLALKTDGTLWSWGFNDYGQLGDLSIVTRSSPVQVGTGTTWAYAAASDFACGAIKTDGTLWTWGSNRDSGNANMGTLGQNTSALADVSSPVQVGADTSWSKISMGDYVVLATKTDGTLWAWGLNLNGQLGLNDVVNRSSPVQVGSLTTWSKISAGANFCAAIKTDGTLWTWGRNTNGQLGQNDTVDRSSPVQVGSLTDWSGIWASQYALMMIKTDGTLWWLGFRFAIASYSSPVQIGAIATWQNASLNTDSNWYAAVS